MVSVQRAVASRRASSSYERWFKRPLDLLLGSGLLLAALPVLAASALLLRCSLGPGVLLRQQRVGRDGRDFTMYKFRTMRPSRRIGRDSRYEGPERRTTHKHAADPRHTTIGRFFRATSLDELPQLVHVVAGSMSLVGPRPELSAVVDEHDLRAHPRHLVRPGLTGWWQVTRRAEHVPLHECFDDDIDYLERITFRSDVVILVLTVSAVAHSTGV